MAQHKVIQHGQQRKIKRILVQHANAQRCSMSRISVINRCSVDKNFATGLIAKSRQNFHQRAFTGTILSQDSVDLTGINCQIDSVVGFYGPKIFVNIAQLDLHCKVLPSDSAIQTCINLFQRPAQREFFKNWNNRVLEYWSIGK